jgi:hypothetical protein
MQVSSHGPKVSRRVLDLLGLSAYEELNLAINLDTIASSTMNMMACKRGCLMASRQQVPPGTGKPKPKIRSIATHHFSIDISAVEGRENPLSSLIYHDCGNDGYCRLMWEATDVFELMVT